MDYKNLYETCCKGNQLIFYGKDMPVYLTEEEDYTHAIIMDQAMPNLLVSKENVFGMITHCPSSFSPEFLLYAKKHIGKYYTGTKGELEDPFLQHFSYVLYSSPQKVIKEKTNHFSLIVYDDKPKSLGQLYSRKIADMIISNNLPIDIYGYTNLKYPFSSRKIREFNIKENYSENEPFETYAYSIIIEENQSDSFFSSQLVTSLKNSCIPLYFGCDSIETIFPKSLFLLTGNLAQDMKLIADILMDTKNIYWDKVDINMEKVDDTVNLLKNVDKIFLR